MSTRGVLIGMSGLFAGGLTASLVELSLWPKAALVAAACGVVSVALWWVLRPQEVV